MSLKVYCSLYESRPNYDSVASLAKSMVRVPVEALKEECSLLLVDEHDVKFKLEVGSVGDIKEEGNWTFGDVGIYITGSTKRKAASKLKKELIYHEETQELISYEMNR